MSGSDQSPRSPARPSSRRRDEQRALQRLVQQHGMRLGAARFVAGETLDECVAVLRRLNDAGLHANTTLLGEAIPDPEGAARRADEYERILERLVAEKLRANVALKLTHLGLSFDEEVAYANVERLVARAGELGTFIRIDMEQSEFVDATLRIYERLRAAGHDSVGTVLQSYLYRTARRPRAPPPARAEPPDRQGRLPRAGVDRVSRRSATSIARTSSSSSAACAEARTSPSRPTTRRSSARCRRSPRARASRATASSSRCSTACVPALQRSIAAEGYKVLVATPFGPDWYPYLMRRLAERPANVGFFLQNLVRR